MNETRKKGCVMRYLVIVMATVLAAAPAFAGDPGLQPMPLPDRSILWRSEEAYGLVLPDEFLRDPMPDSAYGYDVVHYDLDMAFDFLAQEIDATATIDVTITAEGMNELIVDLHDGLTVDRTAVDGVDRSFTHAGGVITITLPTAPGLGDPLQMQIDYHGQPANAGSGGNRKGMRWGTHGASIPLVFTLSTPFSTAGLTVIEVSSTWRPCKDVPTDKSTFSCHLTVPATQLACSNGVQTGATNNGDGTITYDWAHGFPVAPYLITLASTNYTTIDDTYVGTEGSAAIRHFVWPEDLADATEDFEITIPAISAFASIFGEYPFIGEKYGVFATNGGPAVEEQTMVAYPAGFINGLHTFDWIFVHELSHMWWGDAVTCESWEHVWLNEGFASYSEALWQEHLGGTSALHAYMENMDNGPYDGSIVDPPYVWHAIVYDKGGWLLHMLRHVMGDTNFFQMLLDYRAAFEGGNANSEDLIAVCEGVYGSDMNWFFDQWLYHEGEPSYEYSWAPGVASTNTVELTVDQVQSVDFPTYHMPIDVRVTTESGVETHVIADSLRTQSFQIPVGDVALAVELDPDNWILGDVAETVAVDGPESRPVAFLAPGLPNPMRSETTLRFGMSRDGRVTLRVFDATGRMIRTLLRDRLPAGEHAVTWDGRTDVGEPVADGVYFCRLVSADGVREQRVVVLR
jgi:aminopeptidase N